MSSQDIKDKHGEDIHEGDTVGTRYRGGTREGAVKEIATTEDQHPHPPKVVFDTQRGKEVAHNPHTLTKGGAE